MEDQPQYISCMFIHPSVRPSIHTYISYITLHCTALYCPTLHYITVPYATLHYITLHYTPFLACIEYITALHTYSTCIKCIAWIAYMVCITYIQTLHNITLQCITLLDIPQRNNTLHYIALHCIALHCIPRHYILILLYITCTTLIKLNHITLPDFTFHYIICITCNTYIPCTTCITCATRFTLLHILHCIAHCIALRYITIHCNDNYIHIIHYITLHYIPLQYTTSHHIISHHIFTSHYTTLTFTFPFCSCIDHATCLARLCPWLLHLTSLWKGAYGGRGGGGGSHLKKKHCVGFRAAPPLLKQE